MNIQRPAKLSRDPASNCAIVVATAFGVVFWVVLVTFIGASIL
jgi:hypothetical protein